MNVTVSFGGDPDCQSGQVVIHGDDKIVLKLYNNRRLKICGPCSITISVDHLTIPQLINCVSVFHKSWKSLAYISKTSLIITTNGRIRHVHVWGRVKNNANITDRNNVMSVLSEYCSERIPGFSIDPENQTISISMLDTSVLDRCVALSFIQRCINIVNWSVSNGTKMSGTRFLTWASFERISKLGLSINLRNSGIVLSSTNVSPRTV
jgi:hypothetical protein